MDQKITAKQERFAREYQIDLNAKQAAIRAGYSAKSAECLGYQLLQNPPVAARVRELQAEKAERIGVTVAMVVAGLLKEATSEGQTSSHAARVSAWVALGKHIGMFTDKLEVRIPQPSKPISEMTDEELLDYERELFAHKGRV